MPATMRSKSASSEAQDAAAFDCDVTIVGYGPVGSTLAILLGQLGHRVIVLERWPAPYPLPSAVHFDHEVGRIFQACGVGQELRAISEPADVYEWRNGSGTTLLRFGTTGPAASGWPLSSMFNQPSLEALLDRRVQQLPSIQVRRGVEVTNVDQDGEHVSVQGVWRADITAPASTGDAISVQSKYVVGCDGANSTVRSAIGAVTQDLGFFYDWLIVDVLLADQRVFNPVNLQVCDPARPTTLVSGGPGRRRWEFMRLPHERLEELNDENAAWQLLAPWDVTPANATLERHAVYTFNARYAQQWRVGRALLAGDAAHLMPPFAGQGMCAGVRDAANLAWKLDFVLRGLASETLLDTYTDERMPSARGAIEFSMELGKVICVPDPVEAAKRDAAMSAAVTPEPAPIPPLPGMQDGLISRDAPFAGHLFVQGDVEGDGRRAPFDEVYGVGWRLVTVDNDIDALDPASASWFESIGGRIVSVAAASGIYATWFGAHNVKWALQRPDFHLYGTAADQASAVELLHDLRTHLLGESIHEGAHS